MEAAALSLGLFVVEELIKRLPGLALSIQRLFAAGTPTHEMWEAERARVSQSYADLVPNSGLPADELKPTP